VFNTISKGLRLFAGHHDRRDFPCFRHLRAMQKQDLNRAATRASIFQRSGLIPRRVRTLGHDDGAEGSHDTHVNTQGNSGLPPGERPAAVMDTDQFFKTDSYRGATAGPRASG